MLRDRPPGTCYLAEIFAPRTDGDEQEAVAERLREAAGALAESGVRIRYLQSLFLASEETAFHVFAAGEREAVERALRDAGLEAERISPALAAGAHSCEEVQR